MKRLHQIDPKLNAFTVTFEDHLLNKLRRLFNNSLRPRLESEDYTHLLSGENKINAEITDKKLQFHITSYGSAPLLWISNNNMRSYNIFKSFLNSLDITDDIKELVDFKKHIRMYCGFFVVGNKMDRDTWHFDYHEGANAYTFITPLFELDKSHGNLMYVDGLDNINKYEYKMNEAVIFGDGFKHTTEKYEKTDKLRVMLSFTMGTDKSEYWSILKQSIGDQSNFMILPCGHQKGTCKCFP